MLYFLTIAAVGVLALLVIQGMDIECVNPPAPRRRAAGKSLPKTGMFLLAAQRFGAK